MASVMFVQNLLSTTRKRKATCDMEYLRTRNKGSKARTILFEEENAVQNITAAIVCTSTKKRKRKGPVEQRDFPWWQHGYQNWTNEQFKRRLRVNRDTFDFILNATEDLITKEVTKFKKPVSADRQLGLTLYRLAHGCSYSTVGDLFGVASSTACQIFNEVIRVIVQAFYDEYVAFSTTEDGWKAELNAFLEDWGFPCVGAWDGFHVYISSNLKNFFNFKKRYSVTNMGLIAANKRFLWAGVGAPGSVHDSTLLQSAPIFHQIESGHVLPHNVLTLPGHGEIPLVMVGDSAFPSRPWLLKAYPDTAKNQKERYFNRKLRSARVVSEHAYGMLKGRFRIIYKKAECRRHNVKAVIMACIALHNLCIVRSDPCLPRWQLRVERLNLIRKPTKRTQDRQLSQEIRAKITRWLWSLRS